MALRFEIREKQRINIFKTVIIAVLALVTIMLLPSSIYAEEVDSSYELEIKSVICGAGGGFAAFMQ